MKEVLLAALLFPCVVIAQVGVPNPAPRQNIRLPVASAPGHVQAPPGALPENYQLTLTITDKDGQPVEMSVVIASAQFTATVSEQNLNFAGSVAVEETGFIITYVLGWIAGDATKSAASSMQGSVRLKLGEEVQIIRAGPRVARLSITRVEPSKAK